MGQFFGKQMGFEEAAQVYDIRRRLDAADAAIAPKGYKALRRRGVGRIEALRYAINGGTPERLIPAPVPDDGICRINDWHQAHLGCPGAVGRRTVTGLVSTTAPTPPMSCEDTEPHPAHGHIAYKKYPVWCKGITPAHLVVDSGVKN